MSDTPNLPVDSPANPVSDAEQLLDRVLGDISQGRFERSLLGLTAFSAVLVCGEVYYEHYKGSFGNKLMWSPIVVLESGPFWNPDDDWVSDEKGSAHIYWNKKCIIGVQDPVELGKNNSGHGVGGSMIYYAGYTLRFHPSDFQICTLDGVGADWPISYWDVKPHYERVEAELPVSGQDCGLGAIRTATPSRRAPSVARPTRGFSVQTVGPLPIAWAEHVLADGHWGGALREYMRDYNHWSVMGALCKLLPQAENRVTLADAKDANGVPVARFDYSQCENDRKNIAYAKELMQAIFEYAGAQDILTIDRYAHLIGGCRMGTSLETSVVDADHRAWGVPNLFVADGSICPTDGSANPALTIMALASRLAERLTHQQVSVSSRSHGSRRAREAAHP